MRLPDDAMLPGASGLSGPLSCLTEARFGIVFGALGAARDCLETAIAYARSARSSTVARRLPAHPGQARRHVVELGKGMLLALHLGRLKDEGRLRRRAIASASSTTPVRRSRSPGSAARILGAAGITLEYPLMRHANNLESVLTYEGTAEVHQLVIGQALTGESAFR